MKKWGPLVLTFLAGILIGSSVGWRIFEQRRIEGRLPEQRHQRMLKLFSEKLDLTADQREKVEKILNDKRRKMELFHTDVRPKFEALRAATQDEIRAILRPDQIEKYNELEARRETRRKRRNGPKP